MRRGDSLSIQLDPHGTKNHIFVSLRTMCEQAGVPWKGQAWIVCETMNEKVRIGHRDTPIFATIPTRMVNVVYPNRKVGV